MLEDPNFHQDTEIPKSGQPRNSKRLSVGSSSRRSFLGRAGLFTAASVVTGVLGSTVSWKEKGEVAQAQDAVGKFKFDYPKFREKAYQVRVTAAKVNHDLPIPPHPDIFNSEALDRIYNKYQSYLLPQFFPEGAPTHSSYPGGASVSAGASVTILKALFDGGYVIPNPVIPDPNDPTKLIPYQGRPLTVEGELNKLAANIGLGRNSAGIHWRTDAAASLALGEEIAIGLLRDEKLTFRETFGGFTFTKFNGQKVTI